MGFSEQRDEMLPKKKISIVSREAICMQLISSKVERSGYCSAIGSKRTVPSLASPEATFSTGYLRVQDDVLHHFQERSARSAAVPRCLISFAHGLQHSQASKAALTILHR